MISYFGSICITYRVLVKELPAVCDSLSCSVSKGKG